MEQYDLDEVFNQIGVNLSEMGERMRQALEKACSSIIDFMDSLEELAEELHSATLVKAKHNTPYKMRKYRHDIIINKHLPYMMRNFS